ncbi:oxidoreductase [Flavobacterium sp.]|uniref:oxidoreductase n=1 Tax=Flavobacterium sp. TaxID=239 RepID=UPI0031D554CE
MNIKLKVLFAASVLLALSCNDKKNVEVQETSVNKSEAVKNDTIEDEGIPKKESINLFTVMPKDSSEVAFVSLSDIYTIGDEKDTLALPNIQDMGPLEAQYFTFEKNYRKRLLSKTNISETDSMFVYDYAKNKLAVFPVKSLKTAAMLSLYSTEDDWPYRNFDFMIGFEINKKFLNGFSEYYRDALVYIGRENPFLKGQLKPMVWKKTARSEYPSKPMKGEDRVLLKNTVQGNTYSFKTDSYKYFLQDYLDDHKNIYARRLLVTDNQSKDIIIEKLFSQSEGTSPCPLNYQNGETSINQWAGKLFKNKPEVVFGFEYISFGCSSISVIDKSNEEISLQCDNRH